MAEYKMSNTGDALDVSIETSETKFNATTGHKHTGDTEDAPPIETDGIANGAVTTEKFSLLAVAPDSLKLGGLPPSAYIQYMGNISAPTGSYYTYEEFRNLSDGFYIVPSSLSSKFNFSTDEAIQSQNFYIHKKTMFYTQGNPYVTVYCFLIDRTISTNIFPVSATGQIPSTVWVKSKAYEANAYKTGGGIDLALQAKQDKIEIATKTATSTGAAGETACDSDYYYVCIATNTWIRFAKTAW